MALTKLEYGKTWLSSGDFPTYEDSEQQVRADMQYHPDAIKDYLNGTMIPQLEGIHQVQEERTTALEEDMGQVDETLEEHRQAILDLAAGTPPEAVRAVRVDFAASDWILPGDEETPGEEAVETAEEDAGSGETEEEAAPQEPTLRISREAHGRYNGDFGYSLYERLDGESRSGSWNVQGTDVGYDSETGEVVLTAEEAYAGSIVFFGV